LRKYIAAIAIFVLVAGFAGIGHSAKAPIKIGAIFSVTGRTAPLGAPEKNTAEMIVAEVNAAGGILGRQVKLVVYDTEGNNTKALTLVKKLIYKDKVVGVIGPTLSGTTLACVDAIEKAKVPMVSCAASVKIIDPTKKWIFKTAQTDRLVINALYNHLKGKGVKKIAIISVDNPYGASGRAELQKLAAKYGVTLVADEVFGGSDTDMTAQLTKIKGTDAEAVICWGTNPGPARVAKGMKQLGMTIPLFQSHGVANPQFIQQAEGAAEGNLLFASRLIVADQLPDSDESKKALLAYKTKYEKKYGSVSTFGGHAYDAAWIMIDAIKAAGSTDRKRVRNEIEKTNKFIGMTGIFNMTKTDHMGLGLDALVLVEVKDGKWLYRK